MDGHEFSRNYHSRKNKGFFYIPVYPWIWDVAHYPAIGKMVLLAAFFLISTVLRLLFPPGHPVGHEILVK